MPKRSANRVPTARFDCRRMRPATRLPAFRDLTRAVYDIWARGAPEQFEAEALGHRVGEIVFNQVRFTAAQFRRGVRHLRGEGKDFLVLEAQLSGRQLLMMEHGHVHMLPGHIYLRDWAVGFDSEAEAMTLNSIIIPRHRLDAAIVLSAGTPVVEWSMSAPPGRLLAAVWAQVLAELDRVSITEAQTLTEGLLGFIDGLLGYAGHAPLPASLGAMEQFLIVRLRGEATVGALCKHFGVSRSMVYRLFASHGGVERFVTKARLERCYEELRRVDPERVRVADVAASWGFFDASAFSRAFRKRFGKAPSSVLGTGVGAEVRREDGDLAVQRLYADYMRWLQEASGVAGRNATERLGSSETDRGETRTAAATAALRRDAADSARTSRSA